MCSLPGIICAKKNHLFTWTCFVLCVRKGSQWSSCNCMSVCFVHILLFLSFSTRWVRWVWLPTNPTILTDGSLDDLVPTPVPALTYTTAMSHLPSSSVRDHMKWVCFDNTKVVTNSFTCSLVSLRMLSLMNSLADATTVLAVVHFKLQLILYDLIQLVKCCVLFSFFCCCFFCPPSPSSRRRGCLAAKLSCPAWPWCRPAQWRLLLKKWWLRSAMHLLRETDPTVLPRATWSSLLEWAVHPWLGLAWEIWGVNC